MQRRARVGREVVINPSVRGGKCVQKFRTHLVQIFNADLGGARCVWLCHAADQRHTAILCAAEEHSTLKSVEVVQVGTRGHAKQAQTAARCPTWVRGAYRCSGRPAARWTGTRHFVVRKIQETSRCGLTPSLPRSCIQERALASRASVFRPPFQLSRPRHFEQPPTQWCSHSSCSTHLSSRKCRDEPVGFR